MTLKLQLKTLNEKYNVTTVGKKFRQLKEDKEYGAANF